jgi:hypothetical protein
MRANGQQYLARPKMMMIVVVLLGILGALGATAGAFVPSPGVTTRSTHPSRRRTPSPLFGVKVTIRIVGRKGSEKWIEDGCEMYRTRLRTPANVELTTEWHKTNEALVKGVESDWNKNVPVVLLDPKGKKHSSESFSSEFYRLVEEGGSRLVYVIGGVSVCFGRDSGAVRRHGLMVVCSCPCPCDSLGGRPTRCIAIQPK